MRPTLSALCTRNGRVFVLHWLAFHGYRCAICESSFAASFFFVSASFRRTFFFFFAFEDISEVVFSGSFGRERVVAS